MSQPRQIEPAQRLVTLGLTQREAEVLFWISQGKSSHDIGVILGASTRTIHKHTEHLFTKLHVENRTAAAAIALQKLNEPSPRANKRIARHNGIIALFSQQLFDWWSDVFEICEKLGALVDCGP